MPKTKPEPIKRPFRMLTTTQAAERLGVTQQTLRQLIRAKRLGAVDVAVPPAKRPAYRIPESDVDAFITAHSTRAA